MADTLMLRKGLLANLANAPIVNGAVDITLDEKAMYVCHEGERIRLGDFVEVATVADLKALEPEWRTSALYYVVESNALLKYNKNGTENNIGSEAKHQWVQINEVSDLTADISDVKTRVGTAEQNITNLQQAHAQINIELTGDVTGTATIDTNNKLTVTTDIGATGVGAKAYGPTAGATVTHGGTFTVPNFTVAEDGRLTAAGSVDYTLPSVSGIEQNITDLQTAHGQINVALSGDVTGSGTIDADNKVTISDVNISDSGVTANTYGPTTGGAVEHKGGITVPNFTVASDGRLTAAGTVTYTLPSVDDITGDISDLKIAIGSAKTDNADASGLYKYIDDQDAATLDAAEVKIGEALAAADAMTFQGVVGTGEGHVTLPSSGNKGDTYKVGTKGSYAGYECYVGDLLICKADGSSEWWHVSSGYEDDYDPYLSATGKTVTLKNTVGAARGAITVQGDYTGTADAKGVVAGGTQINATINTDEATGISNITYTVSTIWGSF